MNGRTRRDGEKNVVIGDSAAAKARRLDEFADLPADKNAEIICFCKISLRGYEAECILRAHGYTNVKVMEGGIMAWPYP